MEEKIQLVNRNCIYNFKLLSFLLFLFCFNISICNFLQVNGVSEERSYVYSSLYSDDFSQATLNTKWSIIREQASYWSLTSNPGFLSITTQLGHLYQTDNNLNNLLVENTPEGNFEIIVQISNFIATQVYHQANLFFYLDDDHYIHLVYACFTSEPEIWIQYEIEDDGIVQILGTLHEVTFDTFSLKIAKIGSTYLGSYCTPTTTWQTIGVVHSESFLPSKMGFGACNGPTVIPSTTANFDYFHVYIEEPLNTSLLWVVIALAILSMLLIIGIIISIIFVFRYKNKLKSLS